MGTHSALGDAALPRTERCLVETSRMLLISCRAALVQDKLPLGSEGGSGMYRVYPDNARAFRAVKRFISTGFPVLGVAIALFVAPTSVAPGRK